MNRNEPFDASLLALDEGDAQLNAQSMSPVLFGYLLVAISASIVGLATGWLVWAH
jgi:hypothetical protein